MQNSNFKSLQYAESWNRKRSNLQKEYYPSLTEADLNYEEENEMLMLDNIQKKLGKSLKELKLVMEKNSPDRMY